MSSNASRISFRNAGTSPIRSPIQRSEDAANFATFNCGYQHFLKPVIVIIYFVFYFFIFWFRRFIFVFWFRRFFLVTILVIDCYVTDLNYELSRLVCELSRLVCELSRLDAPIFYNYNWSNRTLQCLELIAFCFLKLLLVCFFDSR